jgi:hypothetical protein
VSARRRHWSARKRKSLTNASSSSFELDEKYLAELEAIAVKAPSTAVRLSRYSMSILKRADRGALVDGPRLVNLDLMVFRSCDAHALHFENS